MLITGTFIDEISHDIPHQNWGPAEWEKDFQHMKAAGIDTVIVIRCGYRRFLTYPSQYLMDKFGCYNPPIDLIDLYLHLAEKYGMKAYDFNKIGNCELYYDASHQSAFCYYEYIHYLIDEMEK